MCSSDLRDLAELDAALTDMVGEVAAWLVTRDLDARTVTIKVRYEDFTTITRSHTEAATREMTRLQSRARALLARTDAGSRPVRLLGVSVHNLCSPQQSHSTRAQTPLPF